MFKRVKDNYMNSTNGRILVVLLVITVLSAVLIGRLFVLQIVNGEETLEEFTLKIQKERTINSTRGKIYDRNGNEVTGAPASGYTIKKIVDGAVTCTATVIVTGDYNGDGIVNGIDLLRARKALDSSSTSGYFKAIDVDRNGTLSAADVKAVAEIVIK